MSRVVVGTRESALAQWQTQWIIDQLKIRFPDVEFETRGIRTLGDRVKETPLNRIGDKGIFVREIESALLDGAIDLAVHSLKDLPGEQPAGLTIGAVTAREDVRDALVSRHRLGFAQLPKGARIGTSSLRRAAQILHARPDVEIVNLRGNVDTRLRKAETEEYDAVILAAAGLYRLSRGDSITELLPTSLMLPAPGQGALALEIRDGDARLFEFVRAIADPIAEAATTAEKSFLAALGGGCAVPIAALGQVEDGLLRLDGLVGSPDGKQLVRLEGVGEIDDASAIGQRLADQVRAAGGEAILQAFDEEQFGK